MDVPLPPPLTTSWSTDPSQRGEAQCETLLKSIRQTREGQSKSWLNVQPCVADGTAALAQLALAHGHRLTALEEKVEQVRQVLEILVKDRQTKETRYQMDHGAHEDAHQRLGRAVQEVQVLLETERQAHHDFHERVLIAGLRDVQARVRQVEGQLALSGDMQEKAHVQEKGRPSRRSPRQTSAHPPRRRHSSRASSSSTSASSSSSYAQRSPSRTRRTKKVETRKLIAEVRQLRTQWRRFIEQQDTLLSVPTAPAPLPSASALATTDVPAAEDVGVCNGRAMPPQRARWHWFGEGGSHFPIPMRAVTKATTAAASSSPLCAPAASSAAATSPVPGASPALAWSELRLFDSRTDCWYSAGPCPSSRTLDGRERTTETLTSDHGTHLSDRWNCFTWVRPSVIRVARTGIYKVVACLVRDCRPTPSPSRDVREGQTAQSGPALVIEVDDGLHGVVQHMCTSAQACIAYAAESPVRRPSASRHREGPSESVPLCVPSPFHTSARGQPAVSSCQRPTRASTRSPVRFQRACCAPAQTHTYSVHDYLFLSAGALLRVRCRNLHDTKAVYEAFLELEYMA